MSKSLVASLVSSPFVVEPTTLAAPSAAPSVAPFCLDTLIRSRTIHSAVAPKNRTRVKQATRAAEDANEATGNTGNGGGYFTRADIVNRPAFVAWCDAMGLAK